MGLLFIFLPKSDYSPVEKRYLADFPKTDADNILFGDFDTEFESYMSDHVAGRSFFVGVNAYYDAYSGRNGSNGVYMGRDGYLINDPVERDNRLSENLKIFSDFSSANKLNTTLMIIPSTGYIMSDKLPENHKDYLDEQYFKTIEKNCGDMKFLNIMKKFKDESRSKQLFYRTDHHWTTEGAYIAYKEYCRSAGLDAEPEESFEKMKVGGFYGTTYSTSGFWNTPADDIEFWENRDNIGAINVSITEGKKTSEYENMFFMNHLEEDDKYPTFLDGNHALVKIQNKNADGGKLLVLKDSFAHCMVPFLAENYSEIIMVDLRYYKSPISDIVKKNDINECLVLYSLDNFATDTDAAFLA